MLSSVGTVLRKVGSFNRFAPNVKNLNFIRSLFISIKETPNPNVQKFLPTPAMEVLPPEFGHTMEFNNEKEARASPLASKLFEIPDVKSVLLGDKYICEEVDWEYLNPAVFHTVLDYFFSTSKHEPVVYTPDQIPEDPNDVKEGDSETVRLIKELLNTRIRPRIKADGGDIFFSAFDDANGEVKVRLVGACKGCASSSVTLKQGVEQMMKHYIPEVKTVSNVEEEEDSPEVKAKKEEIEKELKKDFEDELATAIADEMKKMKKSKNA